MRVIVALCKHLQKTSQSGRGGSRVSLRGYLYLDPYLVSGFNFDILKEDYLKLSLYLRVTSTRIRSLLSNFVTARLGHQTLHVDV